MLKKMLFLAFGWCTRKLGPHSFVQPQPISSLPFLIHQNENIICRSMRRLADWVLKTPPASAVDFPNSPELRLPIGGAGFTLLKMLRALALKVRL
jgi:hypothetical protein